MEIRRNPFTGEPVLVSPGRLARPWQPQACPFCPGSPETGRGWDVLLLPNRFPVVSPDPPEPSPRGTPAYGRAYVLVETPDHGADLPDLPAGQVAKALRLVADLQREVEGDPRARYLLLFRNRGREIGVSLDHPHSQVYVLPVVPHRIAMELEGSRALYRGRCPHCLLLEEDLNVVYRAGGWTAFVPYYARWPHEVHIYPERHVSSLTELSEGELEGLAAALKAVLCGLDRLFGRPMPYVMALHQAPLRERPPHYHLHLEIYGMYRPDGRLKHAAGAEQSGIYTLEGTPEEAAERLKGSIERCHM